MRLLQTLASLGPLLLPTGTPVVDTKAFLAGKRVGLYFAAGWCPMCTAFEPALLKFRAACAASEKPIELIYVSSDRSEADAMQRASLLHMAAVPYEYADTFKKQLRVWAGAEALKLGMGRRSGVPAIVVLSPEDDDELAFIDAERSGTASLSKWNVDDGIF